MAKGKKSRGPAHQAPTSTIPPPQPLFLGGEDSPGLHPGEPTIGQSWYTPAPGAANSPIGQPPSSFALVSSPASGKAGLGSLPPLNIAMATTVQTVTEEQVDVPQATFGWGGTPQSNTDWGNKPSGSNPGARRVTFGESSAAPSPAPPWNAAPDAGQWSTTSSEAEFPPRKGNKAADSDGPNEWGHYDTFQSSHRTSFQQATQTHSTPTHAFGTPRTAPSPGQFSQKPMAWQGWAKDAKPSRAPPQPQPHPAPPPAATASPAQGLPTWNTWAAEAQKLQKAASDSQQAKRQPPRDPLRDLLQHGTPNTQNRYLSGLTTAQKEQLQRYAQERGLRTNPLLTTHPPVPPSHPPPPPQSTSSWGQPRQDNWGTPASHSGWGSKHDREETTWGQEGAFGTANGGGWGKGGGDAWGAPPKANGGWGATNEKANGGWGVTNDASGGDDWGAKSDAWGGKQDAWDTPKQDNWGNPAKGKHKAEKSWSKWETIEEEEYEDYSDEEEEEEYSEPSPKVKRPHTPATSSVAFGTINGDNYPMPSRTLAHAYAMAGTPLPKSEELPTQITESKGAALAPVTHAFFGTQSRLARDRLHWMFPPNKDPRVRDVLALLQKDAYNVGVFGLRKFLQTRERGALLINAGFTSSPGVLTFDWLTFDQLQPTRDLILQKSVAYYDPAAKTIVFIFLPSKTGNSVAIWRRKVVVPNNVRLMYTSEIEETVAGLRKARDYVIHVDEMPLPKTPSLATPKPPPIEPPKKSFIRKSSIKRPPSLRSIPDGKPKKKKKSWWRRLFRL